MSKEKQIEEMAKVIGQRCNRDCIPSCDECIAQTLYNAGYRKQEWISVDERLPEKTGLYLIVWDGSVAAAYRHTHWTLGEFWNNDLDGGISVIPDSEVTHWMPLPEPPKMKERLG